MTPQVSADPRDLWEQEIARQEEELERVAGLVAPGFLLEAESGPLAVTAWVEPVGLGPIPAGLVPRALAVLDQRAALLPRLEEALVAARSHMRAVSSMRTNDASASVYIDAVG